MIPDANCPQGKAAFTIDGYYTMGATGVRVTEYDQTKAMENADLIINKDTVKTLGIKIPEKLKKEAKMVTTQKKNNK